MPIGDPTTAASLASTSSSRGTTLLLAAAALLGSFLLFVVQPLISKAILPWFGGAASVWTVSMLFFQTALVVGYGGAFLLARIARHERRSDLFLVAAVVALAFLPIVPNAAWKPQPGDEPTWRVAAILAATLGAPYVVLAMTAPLVQAWFVRIHAGRTPYRLYALSNVGSLLGLLAYPLVIERHSDVQTQALLWSGGFALFAAIMAWCAWQVRPLPDPLPYEMPPTPRKVKATESAAIVTGRRVLLWLILSATGSTLLLIVTNYLCQDISSVPFLWVAPLAVYLLTFILAFDRPQWYRRTVCAAALAVVIPWILQTNLPRFDLAATQQLLLLFAGGMLCHGELARLRPPPHDLSRYYLLIACGGALGGIFVGLIAPLLFSRDWERAIAMCGLAAVPVVLAINAVARFAEMGSRTRTVLTAITVGGICASVMLAYRQQFKPHEVAIVRNFYGIVSLHGVLNPDAPGRYKYLTMRSGSTLHGSQVFIPGSPPVPEAYYGPNTGVGRVVEVLRRESKPLRIGVVGLGAGTLAAYGRAGDVFRFYELNPAVVDFAESYFTYLRESQGRCDTVLGDARLSLEAASPQRFDLLVLDAFTGDAIPTHLLTVEAFAVWLRQLSDDGWLAIHVSNRHLDLTPIIAAAAERFGLHGVEIRNNAEAIEATQSAIWIVLRRDPSFSTLKSTDRTLVTPLGGSLGLSPWTDSFSSLLEILK